MKFRPAWRSIAEFYDAYCAGFGWLFGRAQKRPQTPARKKRSFAPHGESLERRDLPVNSLSFSMSSFFGMEMMSPTTVTVNLSRTDSSTVTVDYATSDNTATDGNDYTAASGTLTFGATEFSKTFTVAILQDSLDEATESINLTLSNPTNASLGSPNTATIDIMDDDPAPTVSFTTSGYSVAETIGTRNLVVNLSAASGATVTVNYSTSAGSATSGSDYTAIGTTTLTFNPGETSKNFDVSITNDGSSEYDETFTVNLASPSNATLGSFSTATLKIEDDEAVWTVGDGYVNDAVQKATVAVGPNAPVDLGQGEMSLKVPILDDSNVGECGCDSSLDSFLDFDIALVYNTDSFGTMPILSGTVASGGSAGVPDDVQVRFSWDGIFDIWSGIYSTSGRSSGDDYSFARQINLVSSTGYYPYALEFRANYSGGTVSRSVSGYYPVVIPANDNGRGWTIDGIDRIVSVTGGVLYVYGSGGGRFFAGTFVGAGTFTSPATDLGSLVRNSDNTFTYTTHENNQRNFDANGREINLIDTHGLRTTFTYNVNGQISTIVRPSGFRTTFAYSTSLIGPGYLASITQPGGAVTTLTQDFSNNLTNIQFGDGSLRTFTYDSTSQRLTSDRYGSTVVTTTYDSTTGKVNTVQVGSNTAANVYPMAAQGLMTSAAKLASDLVGKIQDPEGNVSTYTLDAAGRTKQLVAPDSSVSQWTYNAAGQVTSAIDPLGNRTTSVFSGGDRISVTNPLSNATNITYDSTFHKPTSVEDPLGRRTTFTLDGGTGDILTATDPTGAVTTLTWSSGLLQTATNPLGNVTNYTYNAQRLLETTTLPTGEVTTFLYDSAGRKQTVINPDSTRVTTLYDALGRITSQINPGGARTTTLYDVGGHPQTSIDVLGNRTTNIYDNAGRLIAVVDPLGNRSTTVYDAAGQAIASIDPLGNRYTTVYDSVGRPIAQVDPLGNRATTVYDAAGRTIANVDVLGNRTTYVLDNAGQQTAVIDPLNNRSTNVYDAAGQITTRIDMLGNRTTTLYDAAGRPTATIDPLTNRVTNVYDAAGQAIAQIDQLGNRTTTVFDTSGRPIAQIDLLGNRSTTLYDAYGRVSATIDVLGNRSTTLYDAFGRAETSIDVLGNRTTTIFDSYGRVEATVAPTTARTTTVFDAYGRVEATINALSQRTTTVYDAYGRVSAQVDGLTNRTTTTYDAYGRPETQVDALGNVTSTVYDAYGRVSSTIDARTNRTTTIYDSYGRQQATVDALSNRTTTVYDSYGRAQATINALGDRTTTIFDAFGRPEAVKDPLNNLTTTIYDGYGRVSATVDALTNRITTIYDSYGRYSATVDALSHRVTAIYDAYGRQSATVDALSGRTTTIYDAYGRYSATIDALTNRTTVVYDAYGRTAASIDGLGNRTTVSYDALGRTEAVTDPLSHITTTVYDAAGRAVAVVNPLGYRTTSVFDAAGRQTASVDPLSGRTTFVYDAVGNRTAVVDPLGNRTTSTFDAVNREIERKDPFNKSATFAYDAVGQLTSTTDRLGRRRDFTYDADGRQLTETWVASNGSTVENRLTFTYDAVGNQLTAKDADSAYTLTYDADRRVTNVDEPFGKSLAFTYDANNNRTQVTDSDGGTTDSTYNAVNQLTYRGYTEGGNIQIWESQYYDAAGRMTGINRSYGSPGTPVAYTTYTYDAASNITNLKQQDGSFANIANYTYTYDAADRPTTEVRNTVTTTYSYDNADQVTADGTVTVTYDAAGNRNNGSYTTGTGNRLTTDGTWTYTYDDEGNVTKKSKGAQAETWTYGYDQKNELLWAKRAQTDGGAIDLEDDFKYDVFGSRIEKSYDADGAGAGTATVTRFALDAWKNTNQHLVGTENWDVWADLDGSSYLTTRYLRGDVIDQLFARIEKSGDTLTPYWTLTDRLGSVREVINNAAVLKDAIGYNAFGGITSETDAAFRGRYTWTGREIDAEIDLQYNRARYYDWNTGRWQSQDPLGFDAGDSNLYRYAANNASNNVDPSGLLLFAYSETSAHDMQQWLAGQSGILLQQWSQSPLVDTTVAKTVDGKYILVPTNPAQAQAALKAWSGKPNTLYNSYVVKALDALLSSGHHEMVYWEKSLLGPFYSDGLGWNFKMEPLQISDNQQVFEYLAQMNGVPANLATAFIDHTKIAHTAPPMFLRGEHDWCRRWVDVYHQTLRDDYKLWNKIQEASKGGIVSLGITAWLGKGWGTLTSLGGKIGSDQDHTLLQVEFKSGHVIYIDSGWLPDGKHFHTKEELAKLNFTLIDFGRPPHFTTNWDVIGRVYWEFFQNAHACGPFTN